jgi:hypothetical protein
MTMTQKTLSLATVTLLALAMPSLGWAHCDTLDGPVVSEARVALESGDVTPLLKWVAASDEADIRSAFERTRAVRKLGPEARELADTYFFEALVRIHRAGEGAPFSGLKPAGDVDPAVALADKALETGSAEKLSTAITGHVAEGVHERFERAAVAKKHADDSVEAGRAFVAAYVEFTHYVEGLHQAAVGLASDHEHADHN